MFCSTIIPTVGRPTLSRAVCSVLDQEFDHDEYEVIVVNDSGKPLRVEQWQKSARVRIIDTNRHNRSVARNAGAAIAKGKYLHFLDDDDWMLPGVFESFWELANTSQAAWLYGAFRLVDNSGHTITEIFPELKGRLNGHAVRVPLLNASLTDFVFEAERKVTAEEVNEYFREAAEGSLQGILGYEERPLVSIDYVNDARSSIVDALSTLVINETQVKVYAWYDNEWGYVNRMLDIVEMVAASLDA